MSKRPVSANETWLVSQKRRGFSYIDGFSVSTDRPSSCLAMTERQYHITKRKERKFYQNHRSFMAERKGFACIFRRRRQSNIPTLLRAKNHSVRQMCGYDSNLFSGFRQRKTLQTGCFLLIKDCYYNKRGGEIVAFRNAYNDTILALP